MASQDPSYKKTSIKELSFAERGEGDSSRSFTNCALSTNPSTRGSNVADTRASTERPLRIFGTANGQTALAQYECMPVGSDNERADCVFRPIGANRTAHACRE
jgi:hypothetical protein